MIVTIVSDEIVTNSARQDWLAYWKHFSKQEYPHCSEVNCTNKHHHGILVKQKGQYRDQLFVVPLCKEHGYGSQNQIEIDERVDIIPAELCL